MLARHREIPAQWLLTMLGAPSAAIVLAGAHTEERDNELTACRPPPIQLP
jgi:hypothetical protein